MYLTVVISRYDDQHAGEYLFTIRSNDGFVEVFAAHLVTAVTAVAPNVRNYPRSPDPWRACQRGDSILPVLERMRSQIQSQFVRLVLWELERTGATKSVAGA